jgi:Uma2 family endonuclease
MQIQFKQLTLPPAGHQLLLTDVSWQMFETLLEKLGNTRTTRLSYSQGRLEIMVPLVEHEDDKKIIGRLVEIILEELNMEYRAVGSTMFKNETMAQAVEPDECFYIRQEASIRGKKRIDLTIDPPPDLAIEIDITARTHFNNYEALGVPELWRYDGHKLYINVLRHGKYMESPGSYQFPRFPLKEAIPRYVNQSKLIGRNATMRAFRHWVKSLLEGTSRGRGKN